MGATGPLVGNTYIKHSTIFYVDRYWEGIFFQGPPGLLGERGRAGQPGAVVSTIIFHLCLFGVPKILQNWDSRSVSGLGKTRCSRTYWQTRSPGKDNLCYFMSLCKQNERVVSQTFSKAGVTGLTVKFGLKIIMISFNHRVLLESLVCQASQVPQDRRYNYSFALKLDK